MRRVFTWAWGTILAVGGGGLWSACSAEPVTQFVAGISTQVQVPRDVRAVRIVVQSAGEIVFCKAYNVSNGVVRLPQSLGVLSTRDPNLPVAITVTGFMKTDEDPDPPVEFSDCTLPSQVNQGSARVLRKSVQPYVQGEVLYLPMPLRYSCFDVDCTDPSVPGGGPERVCVGGVCQDPQIDPETLEPYSDDQIFGNTNTCFSLERCMPDAVPGTVTLVDAETCTYALTGSDSAPPQVEIPGLPAITPNGSGLNVRIWYEGGLVSEVLDLDRDEGYWIPDPAKPQQFRLSEGLCHPIGPHHIVGIVGSGVCAPKTVHQPVCDGEWPSGDPNAPDVALPNGACSASPLTPSPSVLYVLMDRSRSMRDFFGENGLEVVLGLSLGDPVFENTTVGVRFVPAAPADCSNSTYGDVDQLDFPFTIAKGSNEAIGALIGDTKPLEGAGDVGDPRVLLDAALVDAEGAYAAIEKTLSASDLSLAEGNRAAVVIIGNRDFGAGCADVGQLDRGTPEESAAIARAQGYYTYTVLFPAPDDATLVPGHDPKAAADAIAAAGGTGAAFDARDYKNDPTKAAEAINTIVSDLSSCAYDLAPGADPPPDSAVLSYFDPTTLEGVVIEHSADCDNADGWTMKGGRIEICGAPCADLRESLKTRALLAEAQGQTPADVPVVLSTPCGS
jgi:hypothetical protein